MIYSIPYVILVCFFGVCAFFYEHLEEETHQRNIVILCVCVFFVFFGFRGYILSDWTSYYPLFYKCSLDDITNFKIGSVEPGYILLNLICKAVFEDFQFFVFICALINTALLLLFLRKRTSNIPLMLMLFISFEGLIIMTNLMRNSIAILLFINSIKFLENRNPLAYFAMCLLALSFHTSALVYFPLYFFFHLKCNKWVFLAVFIVCNIIFLFRISVFLSVASLIGADELFAKRIELYTEGYSKVTPLSIGYLERLLTGGLIFAYFNKLKEIRKENVIFINAIMMYFILYFFFSEFDVISKRFATLFVFGYWIIWHDIIRCFSIANNRLLFQSFIFIYCALKMIGTCNHPDYNYDNVLFGAKSYEERLYLYNKNYVDN